jgi:hypothetical protein
MSRFPGISDLLCAASECLQQRIKKCLDGARKLAAHPLTFLALNPFFSLWPLRNIRRKRLSCRFFDFRSAARICHKLYPVLHDFPDGSKRRTYLLTRAPAAGFFLPPRLPASSSPPANDNTPHSRAQRPPHRALNNIASLHLLDHQHRIGAEPVLKTSGGDDDSPGTTPSRRG